MNWAEIFTGWCRRGMLEGVRTAQLSKADVLLNETGLVGVLVSLQGQLVAKGYLAGVKRLYDYPVVWCTLSWGRQGEDSRAVSIGMDSSGVLDMCLTMGSKWYPVSGFVNTFSMRFEEYVGERTRLPIGLAKPADEDKLRFCVGQMERLHGIKSRFVESM